MTDAPSTQETTSTTEAASADEGKGSKAAVLADLAAERDKRQSLEQTVQQLQQSQQAQAAALAKAFGLTPEETSDVSALAKQVTDLQEEFAKTQHKNLVLTVASDNGISDKEDIAVLQSVTDEATMRTIAARLAKANEATSSTPKPDRSQGGAGEPLALNSDGLEEALRSKLGI